jgi:hypothetical protein
MDMKRDFVGSPLFGSSFRHSRLLKYVVWLIAMNQINIKTPNPKYRL